MGGEIIAEKFALLKTRGSNGVSFTHFVEDTMLGCRAVVKVSDKLEDLGLEYLKTVNLARESEIPGLLLPFEGGILDEEAGYYLAFPELGEPSLENYLRIGAPITCRDILGIGGKILHILEGLHRAGFCHLFINTRNVFYRPRGEVTLKDPALSRDYFHLFLELTAAADFSYFSPGVMDGGQPGSEADLYALGRLIERLLEQAVDAGAAPEEATARWLARRCGEAGSGEEVASAADIRRELEEVIAAEGKPAVVDGDIGITPVTRRRGAKEASPSHGGPDRHRSRGAGIALAVVLVLILLCGVAGAYLVITGGESAPALGRGGGSLAGAEASREAFLEIKGIPAAQEAEHVDDAVGGKEASGVECATGEAVSTGGSGELSPREAGAVSPPAVTPAADPSPLPPVASFTLAPAEGQSPLQVYLDASASYDPDGSIVSFTWSCGGSARSYYHVFESNVIPAVIPVTLTVTDDGGHSARVTLCVTLY